MDNTDLKGLVEAFGWYEIPSRNPFMTSFKNDENKERMNVYFTTGTIQVQGLDGSFSIYRNIHSLPQVEEILNDHNR